MVYTNLEISSAREGSRAAASVWGSKFPQPGEGNSR